MRLAPQVPLSSMVDLTVFAPLAPSITLDEARRTLGEPLASRPDGGEGARYLYRDDSAYVELAHLRESTPFGTWENWSVFSTPKRNGMTVLKGPLRALLRRAAGVDQIIIHESRTPTWFAFSAWINGDELSTLRWYEIRD